MQGNTNFLIIIFLASLFYFYKEYESNKEILAKIKFGKSLFFLQSVVAMLVLFLINMKLISLVVLIILIPFLAMNLWLNYEMYKQNGSIQRIIYSACIYFMIVIIFVNLH